MRTISKKGKRLTGEARREQIIRNATELFARHGFRGVTMRQLATKAGISEAMIYHHFPSKEALYDAMLQHKIESSKHLFYPVEAAKSKQDKVVLETIVGNFLKEHAKDNSFLRMSLYSALDGHQFARKIVRGPMQEFFEFLSSYLADRMENGALKRMGPQLAARLLVGMAHYMTLLKEVYQDPAIRNIDTEDLKNAILDLFWNGISGAPTPDGPSK